MSDLTSDLEVNVKMLLDTVTDLDDDVTNGGDIDTERGLVCFALLEEVNRRLASSRTSLCSRLAEQMPSKRITVTGAGTFERHRRNDRKKWDTDDLLRAVLDTRLPSHGDPNTYIEETQLQKVLHVWNLGAPRTTSLKARGLDPDEWCETTPGGWAIEVIS